MQEKCSFNFTACHNYSHVSKNKTQAKSRKKPYHNLRAICVQLFWERLSEKGKRDKPERYCGWFWFHCSSKKFEGVARETIDVFLRVLKESNNRRFDSYSVRNSLLIISHITFRDCRVHIFSDNLSRNSCKKNRPILLLFNFFSDPRNNR